ncbi:unnamed protein product [Amoebophrya sp. A120]|nr:unnamed protein product [Amoebophrya sp. A120]|eukprot:GSA120T00011160001.1
MSSAPPPTNGSIQDWIKRWGLNADSEAILRALDPKQQSRVMSSFSPSNPHVTDYNKVFQKFTQPRLFVESDLFLERHMLDERSKALLKTLPPPLLAHVIAHFQPGGHRDPDRLLANFVAGLKKRKIMPGSTSVLPPPGAAASTPATSSRYDLLDHAAPAPRRSSFSAASSAARNHAVDEQINSDHSSEAEISDFVHRNQLRPECESALRRLPADARRNIMENFKPRRETRDPSSLFMAFVRQRASFLDVDDNDLAPAVKPANDHEQIERDIHDFVQKHSLRLGIKHILSNTDAKSRTSCCRDFRAPPANVNECFLAFLRGRLMSIVRDGKMNKAYDSALEVVGVIDREKEALAMEEARMKNVVREKEHDGSAADGTRSSRKRSRLDDEEDDIMSRQRTTQGGGLLPLELPKRKRPRTTDEKLQQEDREDPLNDHTSNYGSGWGENPNLAGVLVDQDDPMQTSVIGSNPFSNDIGSSLSCSAEGEDEPPLPSPFEVDDVRLHGERDKEKKKNVGMNKSRKTIVYKPFDGVYSVQGFLQFFKLKLSDDELAQLISLKQTDPAAVDGLLREFEANEEDSIGTTKENFLSYLREESVEEIQAQYRDFLQTWNLFGEEAAAILQLVPKVRNLRQDLVDSFDGNAPGEEADFEHSSALDETEMTRKFLVFALHFMESKGYDPWQIREKMRQLFAFDEDDLEMSAGDHPGAGHQPADEGSQLHGSVEDVLGLDLVPENSDFQNIKRDQQELQDEEAMFEEIDAFCKTNHVSFAVADCLRAFDPRFRADVLAEFEPWYEKDLHYDKDNNILENAMDHRFLKFVRNMAKRQGNKEELLAKIPADKEIANLITKKRWVCPFSRRPNKSEVVAFLEKHGLEKTTAGEKFLKKTHPGAAPLFSTNLLQFVLQDFELSLHVNVKSAVEEEALAEAEFEEYIADLELVPSGKEVRFWFKEFGLDAFLKDPRFGDRLLTKFRAELLGPIQRAVLDEYRPRVKPDQPIVQFKRFMESRRAVLSSTISSTSSSAKGKGKPASLATTTSSKGGGSKGGGKKVSLFSSSSSTAPYSLFSSSSAGKATAESGAPGKKDGKKGSGKKGGKESSSSTTGKGSQKRAAKVDKEGQGGTSRYELEEKSEAGGNAAKRRRKH